MNVNTPIGRIIIDIATSFDGKFSESFVNTLLKYYPEFKINAFAKFFDFEMPFRQVQGSGELARKSLKRPR